jgi:hypothetical protein
MPLTGHPHECPSLKHRKGSPAVSGALVFSMQSPVVDFRLYRAAFAPALIAVVALMFSLEGIPAPLEPAVPPGSFEAGRAAATAHEIATAASDRPPGSDGDQAAADIVADRFSQIPSGNVSEQSFEASFEGDDVEARNVLITLPGESTDTIVVLAARDAARGPAAASSAAASGVLTELAAALGVAGHQKTVVLASTSGGSEGASGARELLQALPETNTVEAIVVIAQPGASERSGPLVVASSTDSRRTAIQLTRTADRAVETQTGDPQEGPGMLGQLSRLAIPAGLGEQAPLIAAGENAVAISAAGERPLEPGADGLDDVSPATLGDFGRAAQSIVQAIDADPEALVHGPDTYVEVGGNLVPGWALALLGLALLLPAAVAAVDALARASRFSERPLSSVLWALSRGLAPLGGVVVLYALALVGIVPSPSFPFDPGRYPIGLAAIVTALLFAAAVVGGAVLSHGLRPPSHRSRGSLVAGLGAVSASAGLLAWLQNPYLGLLAAPIAHVWLLADRPGGRVGRSVAIVAALASLLPTALAVGNLASALDLGADTPWTFAIMLADGQIGLAAALAACFLVAGLAGTVAVCARPLSPPTGPNDELATLPNDE